jgi:mono/diheme cytochrome c family protein/3-methyladenine DNA glycosylase AlkC
MAGYVFYIDRFAGTLKGVLDKLDYLEDLGITYVHFMPCLKPRPGDSDGGYSVMDYRAINPDYGTMADFEEVTAALRGRGISVCIDLVLNHTAKEHAWAQAAARGDARYQDYYLMFDDPAMPRQYERSLVEVFPDNAPGNFTEYPHFGKWVWTTFNEHQWDLNWANPAVFVEIVDIMLYLANRGVDVLRLDAVAFMWKRLGTRCQSEPEVHMLLQALRACCRIACPAVIHLEEAIVAPAEMLPELCTIKDEKEILVLAHLAIRLSGANLPDTDKAVAELLVAHGDNALVREGALTGARGREVALTKAVAALGSVANLKQTGPVLDGFATLISQAGKAGPFEGMLEIAASLGDRTNLRAAILRGLDQSIRDPRSKKAVPLKTIWLNAEPASLTKLKKTVTDANALKNLVSVTARLAWVGKPGAPSPPKVIALTKEQQALLEKGKVTYTNLCAACHQPHGYGLDGLAPPLVDSDWVLGKPDVTARIILQGLGGPVKVGNRTWDLTMPPMGMLSDEDIAGVMTYVRREWEHNGSPVDAKFVTGIRKQYADHPNSWTADELRPPTKKGAK